MMIILVEQKLQEALRLSDNIIVSVKLTEISSNYPLEWCQHNLSCTKGCDSGRGDDGKVMAIFTGLTFRFINT